MIGWLTYIAAVLVIRHLWFRGTPPVPGARMVRR